MDPHVQKAYQECWHLNHTPCLCLIGALTQQMIRYPKQKLTTNHHLLGLLCLQAGHGADSICVQQLVLCAVYTATNALRRTTGFTGLWKELLLQYMHQDAGQSAFAQQALHAHLESARRKRGRLG